jgi:tRNA threonylcarbamoyladenosine biosynthesis protein TsaE
MNSTPTFLILQSEAETADLARALGARLRTGDCLLLKGQIGAGKTHFARHLIQSLLKVPEDVPSPTFTLVQTYDAAAGEIWHADLYRLTSPDEIEELGLADAFQTAICLIEWPERLGPLTPADALTLTFASRSDAPDSRELSLNWSDAKWDRILEPLCHA